jgi:hypothetical protein
MTIIADNHIVRFPTIKRHVDDAAFSYFHSEPFVIKFANYPNRNNGKNVIAYV